MSPKRYLIVATHCPLMTHSSEIYIIIISVTTYYFLIFWTEFALILSYPVGRRPPCTAKTYTSWTYRVDSKYYCTKVLPSSSTIKMTMGVNIRTVQAAWTKAQWRDWAPWIRIKWQARKELPDWSDKCCRRKRYVYQCTNEVNGAVFSVSWSSSTISCARSGAENKCHS